MPPSQSAFASEFRFRFPSLDGIRALSILAVMVGHLAGTRHAYPLRPFMGPLAVLGVRVFFTLSGFLITFLLLEERKRSGAISLRGFYLRRILRIFPAFYFYVVVIAGLKIFGFLQIPWRDFAISAAFLTDFQLTDWNLAHFWSLSTEEQFYFVWPALLLFAGRSNAMKIAVMAMLATPLLSGVLYKLHFPHLGMILLSVNAIATGCILAGMRDRLHGADRYRRVLRSRWIGLLSLPPLLLLFWHGHGEVLFWGLTHICIALLIDRAITVPGGFAAFLNWKPMVLLGGASYSLYIWQQLFLDRWTDNVFTSFPVNVILALTCALLSFYLIERPFLALRKQKARAAIEIASVMAVSR